MMNYEGLGEKIGKERTNGQPTWTRQWMRENEKNNKRLDSDLQNSKGGFLEEGILWYFKICPAKKHQTKGEGVRSNKEGTISPHP